MPRNTTLPQPLPAREGGSIRCTKWAGFFLAFLALVPGGCPAPAPPPTGLTTAQATLIDGVFGQLRHAWAGLGALAGMNDVQAYLVADVPLPLDQTRPAADVSKAFGSAIADFESDEGCGGGENGAPVIGGQLVLAIEFNVGEWTCFYRFLTLDGRDMNGSVRLDVTGDGITGVSSTGTMTISTRDIGTMTGDVAFELTPARVMTIPGNEWVAYDGSTVTNVTLTNIALNLADLSYVPQAGTIEFLVPNADGSGTTTATLTFDADSPNNGVVTVMVGQEEPVDYTLAGF
ncbi:MAG: hypothetical protein ABIG44_05260 [Planctomycetota bacterium]